MQTDMKIYTRCSAEDVPDVNSVQHSVTSQFFTLQSVGGLTFGHVTTADV